MTPICPRSLPLATIALALAACGSVGTEPQPTGPVRSDDAPIAENADEGDGTQQQMQNSDPPTPSAPPPPSSVPPYQRHGGVNVEVGERLVELVVRDDGHIEIHLIRSVEQPSAAAVDLMGADGASHHVSLVRQGRFMGGVMRGVRPAPGPVTITLTDSTGDSRGTASTFVVSQAPSN